MAKCKNCKGKGTVTSAKMGNREGILIECPICEGLGVALHSVMEEQFNEATELDGTKVHEDEEGFIDFD